MERLLTWEGSSRSDSKETFDVLGHLKFHEYIHKSPKVGYIQSQMNPVHSPLLLLQEPF
jgi:hypothetical protein